MGSAAECRASPWPDLDKTCFCKTEPNDTPQYLKPHV